LPIRRWSWIALGLILPLAAAAAEGEPFTPDHVARLRAVLEAAISPDGSQVAYVLQVPRRPWEDEDGPAWAELHVVDAAGNSRPFVTGHVNVGSVAWTPDGQAITFLAKRGEDEHQALYRIPLAGGEARRVVAHDEEIGGYALSPDGKQVAFLAKEPVPKAVKTAREKGFDQTIFEEDYRDTRVWIATVDDEETEPRRLDVPGTASDLSWSPAGDRLAMALAPDPLVDHTYTAKQVVVVAVDSGAITGRVERKGKLGPVRWSPDGKHLALLAGVDEWDPSAGRLMVVPAEGGVPIVLNAEAAWDAVDVGWRDPSTVLYLAHEGVWSNLGEGVFANVGEPPRGAGATKTVVPAGRPVFTSMTVSRDGKAAALVGDSPGHPSEVFLWRRLDAEPARLTDGNPWLEGMRLAAQEVVSFKARDGIDLEGVLVHPLDRKEGERVALILEVHGGPESHRTNGWQTSYSRPGQMAAARGFAVFTPNYRGSTGRGVAFSKLGQGDAAGKEFDDLIDAVDALVGRGLVDRDRVGITGGSYGGYASAWAATAFTDRFAASVMFVGISDMVSKWGETDIPDEEMYAHALERIWDNWRKYLERSPIYHAGGSRTPTLILHGDADPRVHPSQSLEMYRHLKARGQAPVRLVFYKGEGHGNRRAASRYDYSLRMMRWMEHYLKGPGGDPPPYEIDYPFDDDEEEEGGSDGSPSG
jgi:dipeptidyl aminopeptidase/acylaminoacyl peptidase